MCDKKYDEKSDSKITYLMNKINDDIMIHKIMPFFVLKEIFCILILLCKRFGVIIPQVIHDEIRIGINDKWHLTKMNVNTAIFHGITITEVTVQNIKKLLSVRQKIEFVHCKIDKKYDPDDLLSDAYSLKISDSDDLVVSLMEKLKFTNINVLSITSCSFTSDMIDCILDMKELKTLDLQKSINAKNVPMINNDHIIKMSKMTNLKVLSISGLKFNSGNCDTHVLRSLRLNKLIVHHCTISEMDVLNLISPSLKKLKLYCLDITDDLIMHISDLKKRDVLNLTHLFVHSCPKITNKSIEYLNDLNLSSLRIHYTGIDDLSSLYIPNLSVLDFVFDFDNFTEEKFQNVFEMPLTHLRIFKIFWHFKKRSKESKGPTTSTTLKNISEKCRTLKELDLRGIDLDIDVDDVIEHLSGMNFDKLSLHNDLGIENGFSEELIKIDQLVRANVIKNHKSFVCIYFGKDITKE
jgi:hypothetical protein